MLPSGKHTKNYGKSPLLIGKSTINGLFSIVMLVYQRVIGYKWIWYHMISYDIMKYHWWAASEHGVFHGTPALMAIWIANMMIKQWIWMYLLFRKCHLIFFYIMLIMDHTIWDWFNMFLFQAFRSRFLFMYELYVWLLQSPTSHNISMSPKICHWKCLCLVRWWCLCQKLWCTPPSCKTTRLEGAINLSGCWRCFGHRSKLKTNWEPRIFWAYLYA